MTELFCCPAFLPFLTYVIICHHGCVLEAALCFLLSCGYFVLLWKAGGVVDVGRWDSFPMWMLWEDSDGSGGWGNMWVLAAITAEALSSL